MFCKNVLLWNGLICTQIKFKRNMLIYSIQFFVAIKDICNLLPFVQFSPCLLLGQALLFQAWWAFLWAGDFFFLNLFLSLLCGKGCTEQQWTPTEMHTLSLNHLPFFIWFLFWGGARLPIIKSLVHLIEDVKKTKHKPPPTPPPPHYKED